MKVAVIFAYAAIFFSNSLYAENFECVNYLLSKNIMVEEGVGQWETGLQATAEPTRKVRRVIGALTELNKDIGVMQGCNFNPNTFRCTPNSTGAMFTASKKTKWFVSKKEINLGDSIMVYGKYYHNYPQTFTNAFGRVEKVYVPVVEALCIASPGL